MFSYPEKIRINMCEFEAWQNKEKKRNHSNQTIVYNQSNKSHEKTAAKHACIQALNSAVRETRTRRDSSL